MLTQSPCDPVPILPANRGVVGLAQFGVASPKGMGEGRREGGREGGRERGGGERERILKMRGRHCIHNVVL